MTTTKTIYIVRYKGMFSDFVERKFTSRLAAQQWVRQVGVESIATIEKQAS